MATRICVFLPSAMADATPSADAMQPMASATSANPPVCCRWVTCKCGFVSVDRAFHHDHCSLMGTRLSPAAAAARNPAAMEEFRQFPQYVREGIMRNTAQYDRNMSY